MGPPIRHLLSNKKNYQHRLKTTKLSADTHKKNEKIYGRVEKSLPFLKSVKKTKNSSVDLIDTSDPQQSVNDVNHYFISVGKLAENIKKYRF